MNMLLVCLGSCQMGSYSYIENRTGADARIDNRALGQSSEFLRYGLCPGMEVQVPTGAFLFHLLRNKRHDHPCHYHGQGVEQELLHKATSFTEVCPVQAQSFLPSYNKGACA